MLCFLLVACRVLPAPDVVPPEAALPPDPVAMACAVAACSGPLSSVIVWRDADGALKVIEHRGDLSRCSHPPSTWLDPAGAVVLVQGEEPVDAARGAQLQAEREAATAGLIADAPATCPLP